MTIFKFKNRWQCPIILHVESVGHIVLEEHKCRLPVNHEGFHRSERGAVWDNNGKRMENFEIAGDKPNRPLIFLGRQ